jgi:hypothetical protein
LTFTERKSFFLSLARPKTYSTKEKLADLDCIFSPFLESSQTLGALKKLKMIANADLITSYNNYSRDFDLVVRLSRARAAATLSDKKVAEQFVRRSMTHPLFTHEGVN